MLRQLIMLAVAALVILAMLAFMSREIDKRGTPPATVPAAQP